MICTVALCPMSRGASFASDVRLPVLAVREGVRGRIQSVCLRLVRRRCYFPPVCLLRWVLRHSALPNPREVVRPLHSLLSRGVGSCCAACRCRSHAHCAHCFLRASRRWSLLRPTEGALACARRDARYAASVVRMMFHLRPLRSVAVGQRCIVAGH